MQAQLVLEFQHVKSVANTLQLFRSDGSDRPVGPISRLPSFEEPTRESRDPDVWSSFNPRDPNIWDPPPDRTMPNFSEAPQPKPGEKNYSPSLYILHQYYNHHQMEAYVQSNQL